MSGGLVLKARKRKRPADRGPPRGADPLSSHSRGAPRILASLPSSREEAPRTAPPELPADEFEDEAAELEVPSDALLCLQSYTRSPSGSCVHCPIFTREGRSHAAPFLAKHVLLHLLNANAPPSSNGREASPLAHVEQQIEELASSNKIRLLQLHGTALSRSDGGALGLKGDGNDDEDVAVMETSAYLAAAEMALQEDSQLDLASRQRAYSFLETVLLPHFAGKMWFSNRALESFYYQNAGRHQNPGSTQPTRGSDTIPQMKDTTKHLVRAGVLLSRSGIGPGRGGREGYWFSLPGLGKAAQSIANGRMSLLRRLRASQYKEKRRCTLTQDIDRSRPREDTKNAKKQQPSGKMVVLDLLAKGWVAIHTTCAGEQFVRLTA